MCQTFKRLMIWPVKYYFRTFLSQLFMRLLLTLSILLLIGVFVHAQKPDFRSPVAIPILLNGNFGEIRANHFHAGIDIKTNGTTGLPLFSIEDGFVSRISVSSTGYGKAIYIEHPSGYTSVYGHLEKFSPEIEKWVKAQQYELQRFEVNLEPEATLFPFMKGDQIAFSGNSGSSAGPHLHFEIRKTSDQHPINPLLNGYDVKDNAKPVAENLYIYPIANDSQVRSSTKKQKINLILQNGVYKPKEGGDIPVWGEVGFGIEATDYLDGTWSKCGIYKLELRVDSLLINSFSIDELSYDKVRHLNSHIDYEEFILTKRSVQKSFIDPGNKLDIYDYTINRGIYTFDDGGKHKIRITIYDARGNKSDVEFQVRSIKGSPIQPINYTQLFQFDRKNKFENEQVELIIPEEVLFTNLKFNYGQLPKIAGIFSNIHRLHNNTVPLSRNVEVKIKANMLPEKLRDKAAICYISLPEKTLQYLGGDYSFGWVKTETRILGNMCIAVDTIAPKINPLSFSEKNTLIETNQIRFKITDNLSGIKSYNGYIDDKWVLFDYDAKTNTIKYKFDEHIEKGKKHQLKVIVEDNKSNKKEYSNSFFY
jgi:hypothetical protein